MPTGDWILNDPNYSEDKFYVESMDGHGHSAVSRVRIPIWADAAITEIIQKGIVPEYRTKGDFIRDAVVHRLYWIYHSTSALTNKLTTPDELSAIIIQHEYEKASRMISQVDAMVERAYQALQQYKMINSSSGIEKLKQTIAETTFDDPDIYAYFVKKVQERLGWLLHEPS